MRIVLLGAIAALGAMLTMPVFAQAPAAVKPAAPAAPVATSSAAAPADAKTKTKGGKHVRGTGPVNINTGSASELDDLKYIGPSRAKKIIEGRPWAAATDLVAKKVMTQKQFNEVSGRIILK